MVSAWFNAKWILEGGVPPYETLMETLGNKSEPKEHKEMTDEEIFGVIKAMNAAFGGEVIDTRKGGENT